MKYLKDDQNAKDATQVVFIKCIDELHKYDVTYFKSWLYTTTKNHCLMLLRKHNNYASLPIELMSDIGHNTEHDLELLQYKELSLSVLETCIELLSVEQQQCLTLFYLKQQSYQQISDQLALSYMQVKSHIQNGKRNLKINIEKKIAEVTPK